MKKIGRHRPALWMTCFIVAFLALAGRVGRAQTTSRYVLKNGLTVLIREMPNSPMVSVYGLVKAGLATEGPYLGTGVSHFLEHLLFKRTARYQPGEIAAAVQAVGGSINASTGMDYTIYTPTVPYDQFDTALNVLAEMLGRATLDTEDIEKERPVIVGEMRLYEDNPDRYISRLVFRQVFGRHPYRHPVIGYRSLFLGLSRDDIERYYKKFYAPNNIILSIAGNIDQEEVLAKVKEIFGTFPRRREVLRLVPREPAQVAPRVYEEIYPTELTRLAMVFPTVPLLHKDLYALDVLASILGEGRSSRLSQELYERLRIVHAISASNYTPMDKGIFEIRALLDDNQRQTVIQNIWRKIHEIQSKGVTARELKKARRQILVENIRQQQTSNHVAYTQAVYEALTGAPDFFQKYTQAIAKVTSQDVQRVARQYLRKETCNTVILSPAQKTNLAPPKRVQKAEIQKYVLDNGLTVLMRPDHSWPTVSLRVMMKGGSRLETPDTEGLCRLMASAWIKGTTSRTSEEIASLTESLGIDISTLSGRNSVGMDIEFLSEDWPTVNELLKDILFQPTFPNTELAKIKTQMKTALRRKKDDIFQFTAHALKQTLFPGHPFGFDPNGTPVSLEHLDRQKVVDLYRRLRKTGNMVVTVFGDIDPQKMLTAIKDIFADIPVGKMNVEVPAVKPVVGFQEKRLSLNKQQAMVMIGFQGVRLTHPDRHGLEVLSSILGSSFSGRIFRSVREELGQAYTLGGGFIPSLDTGMIYFYVQTSADQVSRVKEIVLREIKRIQEEGVPAEELRAMATYLKGRHKENYETNRSLSFMSGLDELYGLGYLYYRKYDALIDQVTTKDIQRLAGQYLDTRRAVVVETWPQGRQEGHHE